MNINIDRILELITLFTWIILSIAGLVLFIQTLRNQGLAAAIRRLFSIRNILVLVIPIALTILSFALIFIEPPKVGVIVSILSPTGVRDRPVQAGLHWIVPLAERVEEYPIFWQTYTMSARPMEGSVRGDDAIVARTADGQEVILDTSIIFRLDPNEAVKIHIEWQDRYVNDFVRPLVRGEVRRQVSVYSVDEVNSERRQDLETALDQILRDELAEKGFFMDRFLLRNIAFSPEYAKAVELKQVAQQKITQKRHEASQIEALAGGEAARIRILAEAEANAIEVKAEAQAQAFRLISGVLSENRDLLTYEYINKLSPSIRTLLVPNNNPLILPLPDLSESANTQSLTQTLVPTTTRNTPATLPGNNGPGSQPGQ